MALWSFLVWLERKPKAKGPYSINAICPIHIAITSTLELAQRIYVLGKKNIINNVKDTGISKFGSGYIILLFLQALAEQEYYILYLINLVSPESCETPLELLS